MEFYIYNTLSTKKERFHSLEKGMVSLYTCGPTVYNYAHIGNLRTYIFEDTLKKSLEYIGYAVKHVMNITDVGHLQSDSDTGEDKMMLGSKRENKSVWEIARFYEDAFFLDCKKLNIVRPSIVCRATEHIEEMINLIKTLEQKGFTYISEGNVYFEIDKFNSYNKLANLSLNELQAGSRVDIDINKKNPLDFVLWFTNSKYKDQIMQWDSPWGRGFPGWHIECSAMALKYLGEEMDIHCGGVDHIPIHHTNEIAQSEAAIGHKWVNYWVHGEFLIVNDGKMSKSQGDFLTLARLIEEGFTPLEYRYYCLQSRYRKQLAFSFETLNDAKIALAKIRQRVALIRNNVDENNEMSHDIIKKYQEKFTMQISDDLNIPNAITVLLEVLKDRKLDNEEKYYLVKDFDKVLSLDLLEVEVRSLSNIDEHFINEMIIKREAARKSKNWVEADHIRDQLLARNIQLIDTSGGTIWKIM